MKKLFWTAACGFALASTGAYAQAPRASQRGPAPKPEAVEKEAGGSANGFSMSEMPPEMWLYAQEMRRRDDPKEAVRRKAEFRTAQRQKRIAAREWFGYSNARPNASLDPWDAPYSAHWSANNALRPNQWIGNNRMAVRR
jgi:hypothetical protein